MAINFNLLQSVERQSAKDKLFSETVLSNLQTLGVLNEDVTHVLAAISDAARNLKPLELASAETLAAFLAGIEVLSFKLPTSKNEQTKQSVLRLMANIRVLPDKSITTNIQPVVDLGAKHPDIMKRYLSILKLYEYDRSEDAADSVSRAARMLQGEIDRALRMATSPRK